MKTRKLFTFTLAALALPVLFTTSAALASDVSGTTTSSQHQTIPWHWLWDQARAPPSGASCAPSDYVLNQVLAFWRGQRGSNFAMLGAQRADSISDRADINVIGILRGICQRYGFAEQPDELGYSTLKAGGEKIGVCRFIN
jgi:hypothetical protein